MNSHAQEAKRYGVSSLSATSVTIRNKNLTSIPEFIFHMPNLRTLNLADNQLETVSDKIGTLKNLEGLELRSNKITSLPSSIGSLSRLQWIYIMRNELTTLPSRIGNLESLRTLWVSNNKVKALPESIGDLKSLHNLDLSNNRLERLPERIGDLKGLRFMNLNGNPLMIIPPSMIKLSRKLEIDHDKKIYSPEALLQVVRTKPIRINNSTNVFNGSIMEARLSNVTPNKRAFINNASNVKNNGTLRRIYNVNGLTGYMRGKRSGRLHGGVFTPNKITLLKNVPFTVNKSAYLRNIKDRLANTSVNNMSGTIKALKDTLPANVNKTDVNRLAKNVARNKVRNTAANSRNRVINALRAKGLLTNEDVKKLGPRSK